MKRCPQCEFIYEDDQSLCDMDGVLLVFDSRTLPHLQGVHALATVSAPLPEKGPRRSRMVPAFAFATLILMLAVASVYYISTLRSATPPDFSPASVSSTTAEPPMAEPSPAEVAVPAPSTEPTEANATSEVQPPESKPAAIDKHEQPPAKKPVAAPVRQATTTKTVDIKPEPKKDDSKVESILKKTGKILKKPFKF
jgi:hypothetical protein